MFLRQEFASSGGIHPPLAAFSKDDFMMRGFNMLTQARLKELLHYDPETGIFTRKTKYTNMDVGDISGGIDNTGYIRIYTAGKRYKAHHLAWLYVYGCLSPIQIDHINHDRSDNRICNLRAVSHRENQLNQSIPKNNKSRIVGVHWDKRRNQWIASIRVNYKLITLLSRKDFFECCCARKSAESKYGFHENHGK